ncbi:MAG: hypothetical protein IPH44_35255 [Myxococcales bacterium]|nr:hypothetical protein [Myxococcales bacterium]
MPSAIEGLMTRPGMFLSETSFDTTVAFICGYDAALMGGLLFGFREWMITRLERGNNLAWPALVELAVKEDPVTAASVDDDATRRTVLFDLLSQFFAERDSRDGIRSMFRGYEAWLATQSWSQRSP